MEMAIIGLGKMGMGLALRALEQKIKVVGLTRSKAPEQLISQGLVEVHQLRDLITSISSPRKIFLYLPSGKAVEEYVKQFAQLLNEGDIVIDGGNSYWGDSIRRHQYLASKKIHFIDMGTSGGISGAREGACFMAGGDKAAYQAVTPLLDKLATNNGHAYIGPAGSGHLVKLIHNGIEFGMLQAIGEGMALLERFKEIIDFDMDAVFKTYRHGSVIRSWLMDLMAQQYKGQNGFPSIPAYIEDTGEVNWLLNDAIHLEVPIPVINQSVMEIFRSRDEVKNDYKSVAMMRHAFGGHPFGPMDELKLERKNSKIGPEFSEEHYEH